jgi:hypothetical protein
MTKLISSYSDPSSLLAFALNLILSALFSWILGLVYVKYGRSLSNRRHFARNFYLLGMTTMIIITIVKSSIALSLGLVGALSIVRFRTAIKEPEELAYLFITISLGLGLGAGQTLVTALGFAVLVAIIVLPRLLAGPAEDGEQSVYLNLTSQGPNKIKLEQFALVLSMHCRQVNLKRFDENEEMIEGSFLVEFEDFANLNRAKEALLALDASARITFVDNRSTY